MWSFREGIRVSYQENYVLLYSARQSDSSRILNPSKAVLLALYMKTGKEDCMKVYKALGAPETEYERIRLQYGQLLVPDEDPENTIQLSRILKMKKGPVKLQRTSFPVVVQWIATYKCSFHCVYCGVHRREPSEQEERVNIMYVRRAFEEAVQKGARVFYIHGGDPLFQYGEGLYDLIHFLRGHDCDVNLSTKSYITQEMARHLKDVGLRSLQISIDTYDAAIEKVLYLGSKAGQYQKALESIRHLSEAGIVSFVNVVITEYNYAQVPELVRKLLCYDGIHSIILSWYQENINNKSDLRPTPEHRAWLTETIRDIWLENPGRISFDMGYDILPEAKERTVCANGRFDFLIFPDGSCGVCDFIDQDKRFIAGNIASQTIEEIWNSESFLKIVYKKEEFLKNKNCGECDGYTSCMERGICYAEMLVKNNGDFGPDGQCKECMR